MGTNRFVCFELILCFRNYLRKSDGAFAKYIVVRAGVQMKTPENLSDVEAASLGVSIYTTVSATLVHTLLLLEVLM
jgi:NADPH:quinone reductase-like Zn-dependent oxidoreductase